jgi:hypothetical protein
MPAARALLAGLLLPLAVTAGEIMESAVTEQDGVYDIDIRARIAAPVVMVHRVITDYDHLHRANPAIVESRVVHEYSPLRHRVHTVIEACILFFCRRVVQLQDIVQQGTSRIEAFILPQESDFRYGWALWELSAAGTATDMHFRARLEPAFWVPPLIGPWLFERQILHELLESARYMEAQAGMPP